MPDGEGAEDTSATPESEEATAPEQPASRPNTAPKPHPRGGKRGDGGESMRDLRPQG